MKKLSFKTCPLPPRKPSIDKDFRLLGFSLAEAMVTMLIVSIALAAAAPIMSKKMSADGGRYAELESRIIALENKGSTGMPDYTTGPTRTISKTDMNSNSIPKQFIAPEDGWIMLSADCLGRWTTASTYLYINGKTVRHLYGHADAAYQTTHWHPVSKDDIVTWEGPKWTGLSFYKLKS